MRVVCIDDEELVLKLNVSLCEELPQIAEARGFIEPQKALNWIKENRTDIALLDIDMPTMNGIELAARIKDISPDTAIIFVTGYAEYAVDAFRLHASGYLLKPIGRERLALEVAHAVSTRKTSAPAHITARTFGEFDLLVDGKTVVFSRSKSKELLAYLVDRQGGSVTRATIFAALWEEGLYDRAAQKKLDVVIRSLRDTLKEYGVGEILEMKSGTLRVCPEKLECDLYRFFGGDVDAINAYRGEYMSAYSWASLTEAYMDRFRNKN